MCHRVSQPTRPHSVPSVPRDEVDGIPLTEPGQTVDDMEDVC